METINAGGAAGEAWAQMLRFLEENLQQAGTSLSPAPSSANPPDFVWRYYLLLAYEHTFGTASHPH